MAWTFEMGVDETVGAYVSRLASGDVVIGHVDAPPHVMRLTMAEARYVKGELEKLLLADACVQAAKLTRSDFAPGS